MQFIKKHFFLLCPLVCFAVSIFYCAVMLHTPAFQTTDETTIRWNGVPYTQTVNADGVTRYVHDNDVLLLEETANGTLVTVELFPYPGKTFRIFEDHNYRKVFSESDELLLEGQWGTDKVGRKTETGLLDPVSGDIIFEYRQQLGWTSPTAAIALDMYEASKQETTATDSPLQRVILVNAACALALLRVFQPVRRCDRQTYEQIPLVRYLMVTVFSVLPLLLSIELFT